MSRWNETRLKYALAGRENRAQCYLTSQFILLQGLAEQQQPSDGDSALPLPMDHVRYTLSTEERKLLYDYVVEVGILRLL